MPTLHHRDAGRQYHVTQKEIEIKRRKIHEKTSICERLTDEPLQSQNTHPYQTEKVITNPVVQDTITSSETYSWMQH